jgi:hypothetical protein
VEAKADFDVLHIKGWVETFAGVQADPHDHMV